MFQKLLFFCFCSSVCFADFTLKEGKLVERDVVVSQNPQDLYKNVMDYYEKKQWPKLEREALMLIRHFGSSPYARDASYLLGIAFFEQEDFDLANLHFTNYLTKQSSPKYFEQAIQYKFQIAEKFRGGARKHLLGSKTLPKLMSAGAEATAIYDEVISALPHHELAAHSLYGKGQILANRKDWRLAIETYQTLIRRFPKHPLAIESYIGIQEVYRDQSQGEYCDPDYLDLAELNLRKFKESFPGEEKVSVANQIFVQMQDQYAGSLFETARFYERTDKWNAAKIYYTKILASYPRSHMAWKSKERLAYVEKKIAKQDSKAKKK